MLQDLSPRDLSTHKLIDLKAPKKLYRSLLKKKHDVPRNAENDN